MSFQKPEGMGLSGRGMEPESETGRLGQEAPTSWTARSRQYLEKEWRSRQRLAGQPGAASPPPTALGIISLTLHPPLKLKLQTQRQRIGLVRVGASFDYIYSLCHSKNLNHVSPKLAFQSQVQKLNLKSTGKNMNAKIKKKKNWGGGSQGTRPGENEEISIGTYV